MDYKKCETCGKIKPLTEFSAAYKNKCKECRNAENRAKRKEQNHDCKCNHETSWDERRFQLCCAIAPAVIDNKHVVNEERIASDVVDIADAIIKKLKANGTD